MALKSFVPSAQVGEDFAPVIKFVTFWLIIRHINLYTSGVEHLQKKKKKPPEKGL